MMTKMLATGAALGALAFAGAALAQPGAYERDGIPASSPTSPSTVNPMPESAWPEAAAVTEKSTVKAQAEARIEADLAARTPLNVDVAARLGLPVEIVASAPVPDTPANRAMYGGPMSHAGKQTRPAGN